MKNNQIRPGQVFFAFEVSPDAGAFEFWDDGCFRRTWANSHVGAFG